MSPNENPSLFVDQCVSKLEDIRIRAIRALEIEFDHLEPAQRDQILQLREEVDDLVVKLTVSHGPIRLRYEASALGILSDHITPIEHQDTDMDLAIAQVLEPLMNELRAEAA
jgi:putative heme iron utilization protein